MAALYRRAVARDFLDVYAILSSGRYTREELLLLTETADSGFDRAMFAQALGVAGQISDKAFAAYGVDAEMITTMRTMFAQWRQELLGDG
nr:hypothetical protein [Catenuloplanes japonicus]